MANTSVLQMTADLTASTAAGAVSQLMPSGTVLPFAGVSIPAGWLACDGSEVSVTTYAGLYAAVQTTYNTQINPATGVAYATPSAGNFRLPDYRGLFLRGAGTASGGDVTTVGGHQPHKTAKNGLAVAVSVSGLKNQMNGGTGGASVNHSHGIGADGGYNLRKANDYNWNSINNGPALLPADDTYQDVTSAPSHSHGGGTGGHSVDHGHGWDFGGSATFSATGSAASQTITGDNETRPVNRGINYIIKV